MCSMTGWPCSRATRKANLAGCLSECNPKLHYDGQPVRRLQELAVVLHDGLALFASDEEGESGGLPVRVQSKTAL